jgi:hypothetical protein
LLLQENNVILPLVNWQNEPAKTAAANLTPAPTSTSSVLTTSPAVTTSPVVSPSVPYNALKNISGEKAASIRSRLDILAKKLLPTASEFNSYEIVNEKPEKNNILLAGKPLKDRNFEAIINYLSNAQTTITNLSTYLKNNIDLQLTDELQNAMASSNNQWIVSRFHSDGSTGFYFI